MALEELVGLTIEGVHEVAERLVLTFTDGTYAALGASGDYTCPAECWELDEDPRQEEAEQYVAAGIWTSQEYADWQATRRECEQKREQEREARDRLEYRRLRQKYGDAP